MLEGERVLAIVPARGGSKGIPRKNLKVVAGLSLVAHAARCAAALDWLDACVLSTDDPDIAEEGRRFGLDVPFLRPAELSGDEVPSTEMWRHAWLAAEQHYGETFSVSVLLEPTSPLRQPSDVEATVRLMIERGCPAAASVSQIPAHHTPERTLLCDEAGRLRFYLPEAAQITRRQQIPEYFTRNGICYAVRRDYLIEEGKIIGEDCAAHLIERPVVNIDEPLDLAVAEMLLQDGLDA